MDRCPQILPECYADTLLIEMLGFKYPNHQPSIGAIANLMCDEKKAYYNQLAIGVMDNDKKIPAYFSKFNSIASFGNLELKKHPEKKHYAIILSPAFELFVKQVAEEKDIDLGKYGFGNMKYFKSICKNQNAGSNQNLKNLLNNINQAKAPSTEQIKTWINEILPDV